MWKYSLEKQVRETSELVDVVDLENPEDVEEYLIYWFSDGFFETRLKITYTPLGRFRYIACYPSNGGFEFEVNGHKGILSDMIKITKEEICQEKPT